MKTLREQVKQYVNGREVRGVTYRDVQSKFPGTRADRYLRELRAEGEITRGYHPGGTVAFYPRFAYTW